MPTLNETALKTLNGKGDDSTLYYTISNFNNPNYQHLLLFQQCFQKTSFLKLSKVVTVWKRVNPSVQSKKLEFYILKELTLQTCFRSIVRKQFGEIRRKFHQIVFKGLLSKCC